MNHVKYNGKTIQATTPKNLACLQRAVKIAAWMEDKVVSYQETADNFNCSDKTVIRSLKMIGVEIVRASKMTNAIIEEAIQEHIATGSISNTVRKYRFSQRNLTRTLILRKM